MQYGSLGEEPANVYWHRLRENVRQLYNKQIWLNLKFQVGSSGLYICLLLIGCVCKSNVTWLSMRGECPSDGLLAVYQKKKVKGEVQIAFSKYPDVIQFLNKHINSKSVTELIKIYKCGPKILTLLFRTEFYKTLHLLWKVNHNNPRGRAL